MAKDPESWSADASTVDPVKPLRDRTALLEWLYAQADAARWGLSRGDFAVALERSASKRLASGALTPSRLEEYLGTLHLEDLALASACAQGGEAAWEHFFTKYRAYLRAAAAAILRSNAGSAEACDLADSLFSELYGLAGGKGAERSLFRYFHGRSSLKTWLRAVLAQRHVDRIRAGRKFEELEDEDGRDNAKLPAAARELQVADPHRARYLLNFANAMQTALANLDARDVELLRMYYTEQKKLAEIGRGLGEHESSVSRHLEKVRQDVRRTVEEILRGGSEAVNGDGRTGGMSEAEIALCFEYGAEDAPIDLDKLLARTTKRKAEH